MDRVEAARGRLIELKAELGSPARHYPCIQCRHWEMACTHPAVALISINAETGSVKTQAVLARDARAPDGLCGPEGALFDQRSLPATIIISILSTAGGRWAVGLIGLSVWFLISG